MSFGIPLNVRCPKCLKASRFEFYLNICTHMDNWQHNHAGIQPVPWSEIMNND